MVKLIGVFLIKKINLAYIIERLCPNLQNDSVL